MRDQQYKLSRRCPRVSDIEGVGPGRVSGSRYELFRHICGTVYVPQVCLFVYLETDVRKKFIWYRCDSEVQKDPGKTAL